MGAGRPGVEAWPEVWDIICPMMEEVMRTGEAIWVPDRVLPIDKGRGIIEELYFRWCYSPIFLEDGTPGGVFTALTETTANVIGERQLRVLAEMSTRLAEADTVKGIYDTVAEYIAEHCEYDLPFANLYALEEDGSQARLLHSVGCSGGPAVWPEVVKLEDQTSADTTTSSLGEIFNRVIWTGRREELSLDRWPVEPTKVWNVKPKSCMVLPMVQKGQENVAALLMVGLSPRRVMDDSYDQFLTLTMGQISTAITNARAREEERRRAEVHALFSEPDTDISTLMPNHSPFRCSQSWIARKLSSSPIFRMSFALRLLSCSRLLKTCSRNVLTMKRGTSCSWFIAMRYACTSSPTRSSISLASKLDA